MPQPVRYTFRDDVDFEEVEGTLLVPLYGVESLHGEVVARLDAGHLLDRDSRSCVLDCGTPAGRDLNALFVGYLRRELGPGAFTVERRGAAAPAVPAA